MDSLVPEGHLLRKIEKAIDFEAIYPMLEHLYCEDNGRPAADPVVLVKMALLQHLYGIPSLRRTRDAVYEEATDRFGEVKTVTVDAGYKISRFSR